MAMEASNAHAVQTLMEALPGTGDLVPGCRCKSNSFEQPEHVTTFFLDDSHMEKISLARGISTLELVFLIMRFALCHRCEKLICIMDICHVENTVACEVWRLVAGRGRVSQWDPGFSRCRSVGVCRIFHYEGCMAVRNDESHRDRHGGYYRKLGKVRKPVFAAKNAVICRLLYIVVKVVDCGPR